MDHSCKLCGGPLVESHKMGEAVYTKCRDCGMFHLQQPCALLDQAGGATLTQPVALEEDFVGSIAEPTGQWWIMGEGDGWTLGEGGGWTLGGGGES
jgi:hypothetical protein